MGRVVCPLVCLWDVESGAQVSFQEQGPPSRGAGRGLPWTCVLRGRRVNVLVDMLSSQCLSRLGRCGLGSRSTDMEPKTMDWERSVSVVVDGLVQSTA